MSKITLVQASAAKLWFFSHPPQHVVGYAFRDATCPLRGALAYALNISQDKVIMHRGGVGVWISPTLYRYSVMDAWMVTFQELVDDFARDGNGTAITAAVAVDLMDQVIAPEVWVAA